MATAPEVILAFDYGAMQGTPAYVAELDPAGRFEAWTVLVAIVTHSAALSCIDDVIARLSGTDSLLDEPMVMFILD